MNWYSFNEGFIFILRDGEKMEVGNTNKLLSNRKNLRFNLIFQGVIVGLITGLVIVLNRLAISKFSGVFKTLYATAKGSPLKVIGVFCILIVMGLITGFLARKEPMISGSGIPQVEGRLLRKLKMNWFTILIYKFLGGVMGLAAGLSLGREGPSVQMGASIGEGVSKVFKKTPVNKEFLITSGASAGLAAAFNSPLSGVIFALEEVHRSFSPMILLPAMAAALTSDFVTKQFLGVEPVLNSSRLISLPLRYYWTLIILGILVGVSGVLFSKGILLFQDIYGKFKNLRVEFKVAIPFIITGVIGFLIPDLLGGGHDLIMSLFNNDMSIYTMLFYFGIKFLLVLICFGSGVPGGIFLPLLLLGALLGNIFGVILSNAFGIPEIFIINFIILAMAGHFASIVKSPITGIVLIMEMTGSFEQLLSVSLVVFVSYIVSDIFKSDPIYESLLERLLKRVGVSKAKESANKTLFEIGVEVGSYVEGKLIKELNFPEECLLVAIKRGNEEIIPKGNVTILGGDYLVVLVSDNKVASMLDEFKSLTLMD